MIDREAFVRQVRDVLSHLDDRPFLLSHPLAKLIGSPDTTVSPEALRRALIEAIEELRPPDPILPHSHGWRRYRLLRRRYVDGATPDEIARELSLSERQCRREHLQAIEAIAAQLFARVGRLELDRQPPPAPWAPEPAENRAAGSPVSHGDDSTSVALERELSLAAAERTDQPADVDEVLRGVLRTARGLASSRGVAVELDVSGPLPLVAVRRAILRHVLLGLLSHAIGLASKLRVSVAARASRASDERSDVGRVVVVLVTERSPGSAGGSAETEELAVARRLAESQGALVDVAAPDGESVVVTLSLPAARALNVLLVDDNPDLARLFGRYLEGTAFRLFTARTGAGALRKVSENRPDMILLDLLLQSEDGLEVLEALKADAATRDIPVVICSVLPDRLLALSLGVADFLAKPVSRESLVAVLERCRSELG